MIKRNPTTSLFFALAILCWPALVALAAEPAPIQDLKKVEAKALAADEVKEVPDAPPAAKPPRNADAKDGKPTGKDAPLAAIEVHDWNVWLGDSVAPGINALARYQSAMPGCVNTTRSRKLPKAAKLASPLGMITFHGAEVADLEIELRLNAGHFVGHWPGAEGKSNRLRWLETGLVAKPADLSSLAFVQPEHWFQKARAADALYVRKGARTERFLTYDTELTLALPIKLGGGADKYQLFNSGPIALHDVFISAPVEGGRRIGWLNELAPGGKSAGGDKTPAKEGKPKEETKPTAVKIFAPAAPAAPAVVVAPGGAPAPANPPGAEQKPAKVDAAPKTPENPQGEIEMSPVLATGSPELAKATSGELTERLGKLGLSKDETALILSLYSKAFFESEDLVVVYRYPQSLLDEKMPLTVYPDATKTVRVALVLATSLDPKITDNVEALVAKLGDAKYSVRESATKRLSELGSLAVPVLKEALRSTDQEVVIRAERLLLEQHQSIEPGAVGAAAGKVIKRVFGN